MPDNGQSRQSYQPVRAGSIKCAADGHGPVSSGAIAAGRFNNRPSLPNSTLPVQEHTACPIRFVSARCYQSMERADGHHAFWPATHPTAVRRRPTTPLGSSSSPMVRPSNPHAFFRIRARRLSRTAFSSVRKYRLTPV